ncbi:MAG: hypothetical protein NZZ41_00065 [Candidatus Dojkabacteria bacterium]|nr:hypothetical protein [Candidatus Dojkabacteria bacterium]
MPRIKFWKPEKSQDYYFFDRQVREYFFIGGTNIFVHKFIGVKSEDTDDQTLPNYNEKEVQEELQIQDLFFLENRDRKYDPDIYDINGIYTVSDNDMDLRQFGIFLTADTLIVYFHYNEMIEKIGRKIMSGDVLEFPHLRDTDLLDKNSPAINKYFVVEDAGRAAEGYSMTWRTHVWRTRIKAIQNQQEFFDILNRTPLGSDGLESLTPETTNPLDLTIKDIVSGKNTPGNDQNISDEIFNRANSVVPYRNYDHAHLYLFPCEDNAKHPPYLHFGDGIPPNGAILVGKGTSFPTNPSEGDYFLRTDFEPYGLYRRKASKWVRIEYAWRKPFVPPHRTLESFINNKNKHTDSYSKEYDEKIYLSKAVKPKVDFGSPYDETEE